MRIFVSYARKDRQAVEALVRDLDRAGHQMWIDNELTGGQAWWDTILSQIRACDLYLFVVSPESLRSRACRSELAYGMAVDRPLLPVLIQDVIIAHAPPVIANTQIVDYRVRTVENSIALVSAVASRPPAPELTGALPAPPPPPISYMNQFAESIEAPDLTFSQQNHLLADLRGYLGEDDDDRVAALQLLQRLRRRRDISEGIARQIDQILRPSISAPAGAGPIPPRNLPLPPVQPTWRPPQSSPPPPAAFASNVPRSAPPPYRPPAQLAQPARPTGQPLGGGAFAGLILLAVLLPIAGLVAGIMQATNTARRSQGATLIVISIVCGVIGIWFLDAMLSYSSY